MAIKSKQYDAVVVGAGAAGLTAAIYLGRRGVKTLLVSKDLGGQAAITAEIENYPGVLMTHGLSLMETFLTQAKDFGSTFMFDEAVGLKPLKKGWQIKTRKGTVKALSVILASGLTPKNLEAPGENKLFGKGLFYSPADHGEKYKNKTVVVVGGGNSAMESVERLSHFAKKIYVVHRRDQFRADAITMAKLNGARNIEWLTFAEVKKVTGQAKVASVEVLFQAGEKRSLRCDAVFVHIGYTAKTDWLRGLAALNDRNEVVINQHNETSMPGIFAAGDITTVNYKQVVISAGEGAKAALRCYKYLQEVMGTKLPTLPDWGVVKRK